MEGNFPLTNGLVAYYPFNGNANDESGNGHNGTNNGASLTTDRFGSLNTAYSFDGISNYINTNLSNCFTDKMSIALWFKTTNTTYATAMISSRNNYTNFSGIDILYSGTVGFTAKYNNMLVSYNSNNYVDDSWHFVVGTYDGSTQKLYLDGVLFTQNAQTGAVEDAINYLIGLDACAACPENRHFKGKIDDVRIYDREINSSEVLTLYSEGGFVNPNLGLVAYYPFNGNANDESGNGHDGTPNGAALSSDRFANSNKAYVFNGTADAIVIPNSPVFNFGDGNFSIFAWIYANQDFNGYNGFNNIVNKHNADFQNWLLNIQNSDASGNVPKLSFASWCCDRFCGNTTIPLNEWHYVGVVKNNGVLTLYYDGRVDGSKSFPFNYNNGSDVYIGSQGNANTAFPGIIDDVRIYNRALTSSEIQYIYHDNFHWTGTTNTDWNTAANWTSALIPTQHNVPEANYSVVIPSTTNKPIIGTGTNVQCYDLTVETGANLTINPNGSLTVNGATTLNGSGALKVKSTVAGTGSFIDNGLSGSGTAQVERYITGNWAGGDPLATTIYHSVSPPVTGGNASTFSNSLMQFYNEPAQAWSLITEPTTVLNEGQGYFVATPSNGVKTYIGTPNSGDVAISGLTYTGGGNVEYNAFNLVGNPFPSAVQYSTSWPRTNLTGTIYIWDQVSGNYKFHDGTIGNITDGIVPMGQGFFVKVASAGTGSITIPNSSRTHSLNAFLKQETSNLLKLNVTGNNFSDETMILFAQDATSEFDLKYDGYKLWGMQEAPQIYSMFGGIGNLSVKALPDMTANSPVRIGLKEGAEGTYVINASGMESFESGATIFLEDKKEQRFIKLNEAPVYSFTSFPNDDPWRFNLHFNPVGMASSTEINGIKIYSADRTVYINIPMAVAGDIVIYDIIGNEISRKPAIGQTLNSVTLDCNSGYYIVKVISDKGSKAGKVFIN